MNCQNHPNTPAEERCVLCGEGLCPECLESSIVREGEIICAGCAPQAIKDNMSKAEQLKTRNRNSIFIALGLMAYGLFSALTGVGLIGDPTQDQVMLTILVFFGLAALSFVWGAAMENGLGRPLLLPGMPGAVLRLFLHLGISFTLGILVAPLNVVRSYLMIKHLNTQIANCEDLLQRFEHA